MNRDCNVIIVFALNSYCFLVVVATQTAITIPVDFDLQAILG